MFDSLLDLGMGICAFYKIPDLPYFEIAFHAATNAPHEGAIIGRNAPTPRITQNLSTYALSYGISGKYKTVYGLY